MGCTDGNWKEEIINVKISIFYSVCFILQYLISKPDPVVSPHDGNSHEANEGMDSFGHLALEHILEKITGSHST